MHGDNNNSNPVKIEKSEWFAPKISLMTVQATETGPNLSLSERITQGGQPTSFGGAS